jgi:hypothetical protein
LAPKVLFFNRKELLWHFLHLSAAIWFLAPHLKHILKKSRLCWAICFLVASVIGNIQVINKKEDFKFSLRITMNIHSFEKCLGFPGLELDVFLEWDGYEVRDRIVTDLITKTRHSRIPLTGDQIVLCVIPEAGV